MCFSEITQGQLELSRRTKKTPVHINGDMFLSVKQRWLTGRGAALHTFFSQQEIQEVVGVGHSYFGLHLRTSEGGVDVSWAVPLFGLAQLWEPTPHISVWGEEMGEIRKLVQKICDDKKKKTTEKHGTKTWVGDMESIEFLNIQNALALPIKCVIVTHKPKSIFWGGGNVCI